MSILYDYGRTCPLLVNNSGIFFDINGIKYTYDWELETWTSGTPSDLSMWAPRQYVRHVGSPTLSGTSGSIPPDWHLKEGALTGDFQVIWESHEGSVGPTWNNDSIYDVGDFSRGLGGLPGGWFFEVVDIINEKNMTAKCIGPQCMLWDEFNNRCGMKNSDLNSDILSNTSGGTGMAANVLVSEYAGNQDLDDNGLVYGFDFYICDTDPDKPPILKGIQKQPDWPSPPLCMTWADYLASI